MSFELRQIFLPNPNTDNVHVTYENKLQPLDDYLGLEVCFYYDKEQNKFMLDGINSSCI
ncbi:hypothetical protein KQI86_07675 [Clostridium sp. MSJ-11]|uniref:Uncharacterized protein n=1 Tax=Clostridium mobile TaxID=2841512 RepID=A0ABS6EG56_9CLOT|nr:hypothetical protein [Clostridium mobile]MBU5484206.1 hypothetical protein [Clostridium mobile]